MPTAEVNEEYVDVEEDNVDDDDETVQDTAPSEAATHDLKYVPEVIAKFAQEKSIIPFRKLPISVFKATSSIYWRRVKHIDWDKLHSTRRPMSAKDLKIYPGIQRILDVFVALHVEDEDPNYKMISKSMVICPLCWDNPNVTVLNATISLGKNGNTSNIKQHWDNK